MIRSKFKRSEVNKRSQGEDLGNIISRHLMKGYLTAQSKWAKWMSRKAGRLSRIKLYLLLVLFVSFSGSYSAYLIVSNIEGKKAKPLQISAITPVNNASKRLTIKRPLNVNQSNYKKIMRFRTYMDSLGRSPTGRAIYDSIVKARPGLLDSLATAEKYYKSNLKN